MRLDHTLSQSTLIGLPWGRSPHQSPIFFMTAKITKNTLVSFDCTDKNKVSFETAKGLLLFLYSHNNNEIMCFSKFNKINGVRSLPALSPFFTDT